MLAYILVPRELSLVLSLHPNASHSMRLMASVWSNMHLVPGTIFYPDEGDFRIDQLDNHQLMTDDDPRRAFGCYDFINAMDGREVRHCNWIRFVHTTCDPETANVISSNVRGQPFFQVIRPIKPNEEIVVYFNLNAHRSSVYKMALQNYASLTSTFFPRPPPLHDLLSNSPFPHALFRLSDGSVNNMMTSTPIRSSAFGGKTPTEEEVALGGDSAQDEITMSSSLLSSSSSSAKKPMPSSSPLLSSSASSFSSSSSFPRTPNARPLNARAASTSEGRLAKPAPLGNNSSISSPSLTSSGCSHDISDDVMVDMSSNEGNLPGELSTSSVLENGLDQSVIDNTVSSYSGAVDTSKTTDKVDTIDKEIAEMKKKSIMDSDHFDESCDYSMKNTLESSIVSTIEVKKEENVDISPDVVKSEALDKRMVGEEEYAESNDIKSKLKAESDIDMENAEELGNCQRSLNSSSEISASVLSSSQDDTRPYRHDQHEHHQQQPLQHQHQHHHQQQQQRQFIKQEPLTSDDQISSSILTPPMVARDRKQMWGGASSCHERDSVIKSDQSMTSDNSKTDQSQTSACGKFKSQRLNSDIDKPLTPTKEQFLIGSSCGTQVTSQHGRDIQPIKRGRERTWWPCEICGKKFDRPSLLKRHTRTHTGEKPHACDVCGKAFSTSSSLNTHRRIHSGEKPHQCKVCGKRFTASSNLYYHRMTHNKEKPHKCDMCSKSFPTPGDLRSHMYIHNGSWPFRCDVCNRGFSKQTNLRNHMLLHSGDKPHECRRCGKKFALLCNLKTHIKTHESSDSSDNADASKCDSRSRSSIYTNNNNISREVAGKNNSSNVPRNSTDYRSQKVSNTMSSSIAKSKSPPTFTRRPKRTTTDFSISKLTSADSPKRDVTSRDVIRETEASSRFHQRSNHPPELLPFASFPISSGSPASPNHANLQPMYRQFIAAAAAVAASQQQQQQQQPLPQHQWMFLPQASAAPNFPLPLPSASLQALSSLTSHLRQSSPSLPPLATSSTPSALSPSIGAAAAAAASVLLPKDHPSTIPVPMATKFGAINPPQAAILQPELVLPMRATGPFNSSVPMMHPGAGNPGVWASSVIAKGY